MGAAIAALAVLYFVAGKLGLQLASVHPSATAVWPPTGIALAALLVMGRRVWPGVYAGAFAVNITTEGTLATSLGIALGNTLEAVVGATLVRRFANGPSALHRAPDVFRFALLAGVVATTISATIGVGSLALTGFAAWRDFGPIWTTWWLGDAAGALVVAPAIILWAKNPRVVWVPMRALEGIALAAALVGLGLIVFGGALPVAITDYPLEFLCLPPVIWAAYRFGPRAAATSTMIVSAIAIGGTLQGLGPFAGGATNESLLLLQAFMAVVAFTALPLAAVAEERRAASEQLEGLVRQRTASLREAVDALANQMDSRRQAELQLRQRRAELEVVNEELEAFASSVSHDLRAPLRSIHGFLEVLRQDQGAGLDPKAMELVDRAQAAAHRMAELIDHLLEVSRVSRRELRRTRVDLSQMARQIADELRRSDPARQVEFVIAPDMAADGDPQLLRVVLDNLLSNAWKFTSKHASARIEFRAEPRGEDAVYVVRDDGAGFDQAASAKLFRPFQRLHAARDFEGTGIGLATVHRIIQRHGGAIWAKGAPERGATFYFTLRSVAARDDALAASTRLA